MSADDIGVALTAGAAVGSVLFAMKSDTHADQFLAACAVACAALHAPSIPEEPQPADTPAFSVWDGTGYVLAGTANKEPSDV